MSGAKPAYCKCDDSFTCSHCLNGTFHNPKPRTPEGYMTFTQPKPEKVAGRFGVIAPWHECYQWQIAEIVGPTGLYITRGHFPTKEAATAEAKRLASVDAGETPNVPRD